jgi:hypothetical protein
MNHVTKLLLVVVLLSAASGAVAADDDAEVKARGWDIRIKGFFAGGTKPLIIYTREQDGQWLGCVGSSRDPDKSGNVKRTYNGSWYYPDLSTVPIKDGKVKGQFKVYFTPDFWIPTDHKPFHAVFEIDATVSEDHKISGEWKVLKITSDDQSVKNLGRKGKVDGWSNPKKPLTLPEELTLQLNMQSSLIGGDPSFGNRCMVLWISADGNDIVSLSRGLMSKKGRAYQRTPVDASDSKVTITDKKFSGKVQFKAKTLDMEPCSYVYEFEGRYLNGLAVGKYTATITPEGGKKTVVEGSFDGSYRKGVDKLAKVDDRPWFKEIKNFQKPKAGEHPRLLFRKSDLPALRKRMKTPEGKAILKRLRYLLNGGDGETMTKVFSDWTHAYMGGGYSNKTLNEPGAYTIGHAAGYGLLYQLTGEKKYAEFGKECFERALKGQRDRDDRYSFRKPGGALRAGPSLGWYAVGYDLIYDALDAKTRAKFTKAIAEYSEGTENKPVDLEALARGTMPPSSNHFGMQVGGASLALLAISGEKDVDQEKIDTLLKVARASMIRNMSQGFGDGGFFAEGDGTGSMASQISFISAIQAWKNAAGLDFVNVERPNARMMTLKWLYLTVIRDGRPDFWPIRGSYGHNVWARKAMSGAGYFGLGSGGVTESDRAAMKYYYALALKDADARAGHPYDTASVYPQYTVSSFINWPIDQTAKNPVEVLPHCYSDRTWGFYAWRNRWKDNNDTVISVLLRRTSGYMAAKADNALCINTMGKHIKWGQVKDGKAKHWSSSKMGDTSSLTTAKGVGFGIDFTGASGVDVMLVTTGKAEGKRVKVGKKTLTFYFPTTSDAPEVAVKGDQAVVGKQAVSLDKDGNITFGVAGK